jgi:hypothetical protein
MVMIYGQSKHEVDCARTVVRLEESERGYAMVIGCAGICTHWLRSGASLTTPRLHACS